MSRSYLTVNGLDDEEVITDAIIAQVLAEASTRAAADSILSSAITSEASTRLNSDTILAQAIIDEESARVSDYNAVQSSLVTSLATKQDTITTSTTLAIASVTVPNMTEVIFSTDTSTLQDTIDRLDTSIAQKQSNINDLEDKVDSNDAALDNRIDNVKGDVDALEVRVANLELSEVLGGVFDAIEATTGIFSSALNAASVYASAGMSAATMAATEAVSAVSGAITMAAWEAGLGYTQITAVGDEVLATTFNPLHVII